LRLFDLDIKINDFKHTEKKIDDKLAELHTTKQNVDNKINEVPYCLIARYQR
jgi:hypothetical protein